MSNGFTKIYREERELLRKINTGAAYEVYMHLKDKYNYFKQDVYDYMVFIAEHLEMSEITVKRTIKKLKEVGLIESKRVWVYTNGQPKSINIYSFPIVDKIEGKTADETNTQQTIESVPNAPKTNNTSIIEEDKTNGSMYIGTIKEVEEKTKARESRQNDTEVVTKEETQPQNADLNDNFDNYSERLDSFIDNNIVKIRQSTDILAQKQVEIGSQMDNIVAFHRNVLFDMRKKLGWDSKDGLDFQQFIDEEINRKTVQIRYERAF